MGLGDNLGGLGDKAKDLGGQHSDKVDQAIEKGGIESASSIHVQFLTDETTFRFVYRFDGGPMWSSTLTPFKGSNTQSPFVVLAAATA